MRIRLSLIAIFLALGVLVSSCKKDPVTPPTQEEIQTEKLTGTWVLQTGANAVTVASNDVTASWTGFTLTLAAKSYSSSGSPEAQIWPASGTWDYGTSVSTLIRNDGVEMSVSVSDTSLQLQFDFSAGRVSGIEGNWVFKMVPQ